MFEILSFTTYLSNDPIELRGSVSKETMMVHWWKSITG